MSDTLQTKETKSVAIDDIEELALRGEDVTVFFSEGTMMPPRSKPRSPNPNQLSIQLTQATWEEIEALAQKYHQSKKDMVRDLIHNGLKHYRKY